MDQKSIQNFKKLVEDFRALSTNVQEDNQNKTKLVKKSIKSCILSTKT